MSTAAVMGPQTKVGYSWIEAHPTRILHGRRIFYFRPPIIAPRPGRGLVSGTRKSRAMEAIDHGNHDVAVQVLKKSAEMGLTAS